MGRHAGGLIRCRCVVCGAQELATGSGGHFRCVECKQSGKQNPKKKGDHWTGKDAAGNIVNKMVRDGVIPPASHFRCVDCGKQGAHYDHRDYSKPLQVDPVCRSCNAKRGPALPIPGSIANLVNRGLAPYRNKAPVARLLQALGKSDAVLSKLPNRLTNEHWRELVEFMADKEAA